MQTKKNTINTFFDHRILMNLKHLNQHRYPGYSLEMNLASLSVGQLT